MKQPQESSQDALAEEFADLDPDAPDFEEKLAAANEKLADMIAAAAGLSKEKAE